MVGAPSTHCGEWRRGGSAQPQAVRWVRLAWNVGDALTWTHELHLSTHTLDTYSHSYRMLLTLSTSASVFLFFFHLPCYWWIPDMTEPPSCLAPHGCLSAWQTMGTFAFIKRRRFLALPSYHASSLCLSPHLPLCLIFPPHFLSTVITH